MSNRRRLWTPPGTQQSPEMEVRTLDHSGPMLRLIRCTDCRSIDELPDYEGNPAHDVLLSDLLLGRHVYESGTTHEIALIKVPVKLWRDKRVQKKIVEQLSAGASEGLDELDPDFYATKNTYQEDALKCFDKHQRPKGADCIDYHDQSKRLGNPTTEGWKSGPRVYLCAFCPVEAKVRQAQREAAGQ